jgi:hypothetical protein
MASSYSTDLKLELMATGENAGTWGDKTNSNLNLVQQAIAGYEAIALSDGGTVALAMTDATLSNARNMILKFTGTLTTASTVTIPDGIEKFYIIDLSAVTGVTNLTIKTASGTGFTAGEAKIVAAYSDATNLIEIALDTLGGTIATSQLTGTIATAQIANDAVGPDQLSNTAVSAGAYTSASITVDAQGRITAASSGSAGAGGFEPTLLATGPTSGTFTANAAANKIGVFMFAGGGGGGGERNGTNQPGGSGGTGGYGYYSKSISAPFSQPYSVGGGGSFQGSGGATTLATVGTVNGGGAGMQSSTGSTGTAPGATLGTYSPKLYQVGSPYGNAGAGQPYPGGPTQGGQPGFLAVVENIGT